VANSLPALTWTSLTLVNGWAPYPSSAYGVPGLQYTKDHEGFVHLRGTLSGAAETSVVAATLPAAFAPPSGAWVAAGDSNGSFNPNGENVYITSGGTIELLPGPAANESFVSVEGVEFYVG
jgi:hypothetical protein